MREHHEDSQPEFEGMTGTSIMPVYEHELAIVEYLGTIARLSAEVDRQRYAAQHDALTGLSNQQTWRGDIGLWIAKRAVVGVIAADLDKFKLINDVLGHPIGDRLLRGVGKNTAPSIGPNVTAGRIGGDEFGIGVSPEGAEALDMDPYEWMDMVYELTRESSDKFVAAQDLAVRRLGFGISIGVAISSPKHPLSLEVLLGQADESMREEKPDQSR